MNKGRRNETFEVDLISEIFNCSGKMDVLCLFRQPVLRLRRAGCLNR